MNTDFETQFEKQKAAIAYYHEKTEFWSSIIWTLVILAFIAILLGWDYIWSVLFIAYVIVFIPACVRLYQYGRAVNKLGKKDDK